MLDRNLIEMAYSFFHQKLRVYEFSTSEVQRDDIEYAINEYVTMMSPELLDYISDGRPAFLREHSTFEMDMREAVRKMGEQLGERF